MNVLFLDVDGVLNCYTTKERYQGVFGVEQSKCERIRRIVRETSASIVLCSTWRKHPRLLPYLWENLGPEVKDRYIGDTPALYRDEGFGEALPRGKEIAAWLAANPEVERFVILDDDPDMLHLMPHLVQTDLRSGITDKLADEVIRRLNLSPC